MTPSLFFLLVGGLGPLEIGIILFILVIFAISMVAVGVLVYLIVVYANKDESDVENES